MGMFSNSLIQGLINPSFGDNMSQIGMLAGSYDGRRRQRQEEEAKLAAEKMQQQQQQTALMSAYGMGQNPGGSDPAAAMAAMAQGIPGLQAKDLITVATAGQAVAEKQKAEQAKRDAAVLAATRAKTAGVPEAAVTALASDPDALNAYATELESEKRARTVDSQERNRQIAVQLGVARNNGAPPEVISDVQAGAYVDNSGALFDIVQGKGTNIEEYQNQETGEVNSYPEKNGRLYVNGKWVLPTDVGLVKAASRTAADAGGKFTNTTKATSAQLAVSSAAAGTWSAMVDELSTIQDVQGKIALNALWPLSTDTTSSYSAAQLLSTESMGRGLSGAAIPEKEWPRFKAMFSIGAKDFFSPVTIATKIVRNAALSSVKSKLDAGSISSEEARQLVTAASSMVLTKEDKEKLQNGDLAGVVKPYINQFLGSPDTKKTSTVEDIFSKYGV
jgi:hypothetical protein